MCILIIFDMAKMAQWWLKWPKPLTSSGDVDGTQPAGTYQPEENHADNYLKSQPIMPGRLPAPLPPQALHKAKPYLGKK